MRLSLSILFAIFLITSCSTTKFEVDNLKCKHKTNPVGIDIKKPRFSWMMNSNQRGAKQTACRIIVSSNRENCKQNRGDIWDSKKIVYDESNQIYYQGTALKSNNKYCWKVTVWNQDDVESTSKISDWTTALLNESDWKAKRIGLDKTTVDADSN